MPELRTNTETKIKAHPNYKARTPHPLSKASFLSSAYFRIKHDISAVKGKP
ncbi:31080_t:CDS:2, partial [Racocetra persica]